MVQARLFGFMRLLRYLLAVLLCFFAGPLYAESKLEPPDLSRYLRWGPLRVRPGLALTNIGYDDNILLDPQDPIADFTATITPRLQGLVLFGDRAFLNFDERFDYTAYLKNTDQNFWNYRHSGRLTVPIGRFGVFIGLDLSNVKLRPIDQEDIRPEVVEQRINAGLILELGWRTELEITHSRSDWEYSDKDDPTLSARLNRVEKSNTLGTSYLLRGRTRLTLDVGVREADFENPLLGDADEFAVLPGVKLEGGGPLSGKVRLGWGQVEVQPTGRSDFSGLVGDAALAYRPNRATTLRLDFERSAAFASSGLSRTYVFTNLGAQVIRYLNRGFGVDLGGSFGTLVFPGDVSLEPREDDLERFEVGVRLRLAENSLGRRVEYRLKLEKYRRRSTQPGLDNDQTIFGLDAIVGY